jgi:hypothetical protein
MYSPLTKSAATAESEGCGCFFFNSSSVSGRTSVTPLACALATIAGDGEVGGAARLDQLEFQTSHLRIEAGVQNR